MSKFQHLILKIRNTFYQFRVIGYNYQNLINN